MMTPRKLHAMLNRVTYTIIARNDCLNKAGTIPLSLQLFINGDRLVIPLSIYVPKNTWNVKKRMVKATHPQCVQLNAIIEDAKAKVLQIQATANKKNLLLSRSTFRSMYEHTLNDNDFVQFWQQHLEHRRGSIEESSYRQQKSALKKFTEFKAVVPFDRLNVSLIDDYERYLRKKKNNTNTISTALKNLKVYINAAIQKGYEIKNPFDNYKIKNATGRIIFLTPDELQEMVVAYNTQRLIEPLHQSLMVFLMQCFTSLRISDARRLNESWINGSELTFIPYKTRRYQKQVSFGLSDVAMRLVNDFLAYRRNNTIKADQKINLDLKIIAAKLQIEKTVSTHTARHTFATTFLSVGGKVETLREIMGHTSILTTMQYVHLIDGQKTAQMQNFNALFR